MAGVVEKGNTEYPRLLAEIGDAPKQLYYKGTWHSELFDKCLAVVGTRKMTTYGRQVTNMIVGEIARAGITIVSGFMYGIDAQAHQSALNCGGKTIAVMPCGIDVIHPEYQIDLYEKILYTGGLIISEYESTHPATQWTFPRRNRIVAGLSKATLVVEAGEGSGALITAGFAKTYGRKVFAIPNPLTSGVSQGVTQLLKEGATLVSSAQDVLQFYGMRLRPNLKALSPKPAKREIGGELEQNIMRELAREPMAIDELARKLLVSAARLGAALSLLQLEGQVSEEEGKMYAT